MSTTPPAAPVRLSDAVALATTSAALVAVLVGWTRLAAPAVELSLFGAALALLLAAVRLGHTGRPSRDNAVRIPAYTVWFYVFHRGAGVLIGELGLPTWERELSALDHAVLGTDVSLALQHLHSPALTEVIQLCYFSFYFVLLALPVYLWTRGRHADLRVVMTMLVGVHGLVVLGNVLLPARWPVLLGDDPALADLIVYPFEMKGLWLAETLRESIVAGTRMYWDSFPSGHTSLTLTVTLAAARFVPRLLWGMVPLALAIVFATMYLRYHYGADIVAGVLVAAVAARYVPRWVHAWDRRFARPAAAADPGLTGS